MSKLRSRLENYVVQQTGDLVDDLPDERRTELAEVLHDLEGFSPRAAEAEERTEELVAKLENRNAALAKSRARITELERGSRRPGPRSATTRTSSPRRSRPSASASPSASSISARSSGRARSS